MNLTDLSLILIGETSKRKTISLFFPNLSENSVNILNINIKKKPSISNSTLSRIINFSYADDLRSNSINTILIDNLIKFKNKDEKLNNILKLYTKSIDDIEYFVNENGEKIINCFKNCLYLIEQNRLIPKKYLDVINTYIINERYDIVLFLMGSLLILSSAIKNKENFDESDLKYKKLNQALTILDDFQDYTKYLNKKDYLYEQYIPMELEVNRSHINSISHMQKDKINFSSISHYTNTRDDVNRSFFINTLKDYTCKELFIMSRFASSWTIGELYETLLDRLTSNTIVVKMLLISIDSTFAYIYNDSQNHLKNNSFPIYEQLAKDFPNNFFLRYITVPLTNRMVCDVTNKKMRIDYLTIPPISNKILVNYFNGNDINELMYYNQYLKQFEKVWNEYSVSIENQYNYSKFCRGNVTDDKFYNFYSYCLDNSKSIGIVSLTAFSWIGNYNVSGKLFQRLKEKDFKIEFILLDPNTDHFANTIGSVEDTLNPVLKDLQGFKDLVYKYPNNVSVYLTRHFISDTITVNFTTEVMRVDNHIWHCDNPYNIRPSMIVPNNHTDLFGYYSAYLQEYNFIKNSNETYKLIP